MSKYVWHKQSIIPNLEMIDCFVYDDIKDFKIEPSGHYVLIRIDAAEGLIEAAVCNKKHVIIKVFRARRAQALYHGIFAYERRYRKKWFTSKDHIAYLGKEFNKAELALKKRTKYWQE